MPGLSHGSPLSTPMLLGLLLAASTLPRCETSSGCRGGDQHLGEYTNTSPSVSGDVAVVDPVVGKQWGRTHHLQSQVLSPSWTRRRCSTPLQ